MSWGSECDPGGGGGLAGDPVVQEEGCGQAEERSEGVSAEDMALGKDKDEPGKWMLGAARNWLRRWWIQKTWVFRHQGQKSIICHKEENRARPPRGPHLDGKSSTSSVLVGIALSQWSMYIGGSLLFLENKILNNVLGSCTILELRESIICTLLNYLH